MTNYYSPTVVQPNIPLEDITPLEKLLLKRIFSTAEDNGKIYLYSDEGPNNQLSFPAEKLREALTASAQFTSQIAPIVEEAINETPDDAETIDIDLSLVSFEPILQDIVRRSTTLAYIQIMTSFTCSKMRPDGFGGSATFITAEAITYKSTSEFLEQMIALSMHKSAGATFYIDDANSNDQYLYVDIPARHATVAIKAETEGVVVDIYPLNDPADGPAATAAVLTSDLNHDPDSNIAMREEEP